MDNLTNKTIRKALERMAEMHTHLINQIIKKKKFPEILKISKVIPISKKGKPNMTKLHVVLMKAAKATIGLPCYRWSNQRILETVGWIPLKEMIEKAKLKVLHNILITKQPTMLYNQLKIPERRTKAITVRYNIRKEKLKKFFLTTTIETYNKLPVLMKNLDQRRFKKAITKKFNKEFITTTKAKKKK